MGALTVSASLKQFKKKKQKKNEIAGRILKIQNGLLNE
jgi:hypothetical protein